MSTRAHWRMLPCYRGRMRWLVCSSMCFAACSVPNPVFGVEESGSAETTVASADTGSSSLDDSTTRPPTTSVGTHDTTHEPTTAGLDDTGTSDTGSVTSMSGTSTVSTTTLGTGTDPGETGSTGEMTIDPDTGMASDTLMEPECVVQVGILPERVVKADGLAISCGESQYTFIGPIQMQGDYLLITDVKNCADPVPNPVVYELGSGWDGGMATQAECVHALVRWDKDQPDCTIGTILVREYSPMNVPGEYLLLAAFHPSTDPNSPMKPMFKPYMPCMCPADNPGCCNGTPPGDYKLKLPDVEVAPGLIGDTMLGATPMKFHNYGSYVETGCADDPNNEPGFHADWVAYKTP